MRAFAEVLGPGTGDAAAGLLLFFDDGRYIFECGDGTQRFCTERSVRLGRLRGIFLTSLTAPSLGGLLGMVLTIADAGKRQVTIAGPEGLPYVFGAAQSAAFYHRPSMEMILTPVSASNSSTSSPFPEASVVCDDENLQIRAVPIAAPPDSASEPLRMPSYEVLSYVCRLKDIPGKFNPQKAMQLGIQVGPKFGLLKKGIPVKADDGRVVEPSDVVSPSCPGPIVIIVACPSLRFIPNVVGNPELCPKRLGIVCDSGVAVKGGPVCVLYHRVPQEVLAAPDYSGWCAGFGTSVSHVTLHSSLAPERIIYAAHATDLDALRRYDGKRFKPPWPRAAEAAARGQASKGHEMHEGPAESFIRGVTSYRKDRWRVGDSGARFVLAPVDSYGFDDTEVPPRFVDLPHSSDKSESDLWRTLCADGLDSDLPAPTCMSRIDRTTAEVCFLGTAGAIPGKHRNVSGNLLNMFSRGCVLLDCGEGTWGQLTRAYGISRARELLCALNIVFISHIHADHHLGLLTLLYERAEAIRHSGEPLSNRALIIVGPTQLLTWLNEYHSVTYDDTMDWKSFKFLDARDLLEPQSLPGQVFADSFGLNVTCVEVIHCPNSYGIVLADRVNEWIVVYSGDTRPCQALATAGHGATLAIHEATLSDDMLSEAIEKRHCTTSEGLKVCGEWMRAWRTVLTHFSQRYPRVPVLNQSAMASLRVNRAAIAFDLMRINFADLATIPMIMPAIRQTFPGEIPAE